MVLSKIERCSNKITVDESLARLEKMINKTTMTLKEDYPNRSIVTGYFNKVNARIDANTVSPE